MSTIISVIDNQPNHMEMRQNEGIRHISVHGRIGTLGTRRQGCKHRWTIRRLIAIIIDDSEIDSIDIGKVDSNVNERVVVNRRKGCNWHQTCVLPRIEVLKDLRLGFGSRGIIYEPGSDIGCVTIMVKHALI